MQKGAGRGLPVCVIGLRRRRVASSRVRLANFVCFVRLHLLFATAFQSIFTTLAHTPRTHAHTREEKLAQRHAAFSLSVFLAVFCSHNAHYSYNRII